MMSSTEQQQRALVCAVALSWERTPYHHAGRVKGCGVDCAMLLAEVYHEAGMIEHIEPEPYPSDWYMHRDRDRFLEWVERCGGVPTQTPLPGDIAMYSFGRATSHGAIILDWPTIIHSVVGKGVMRDNAQALPRLDKRFVGFWTLWPEGGRK